MTKGIETRLADGQLSNTETELLEIEGYSKDIEGQVSQLNIRSIILVNTHNASITINIQIKKADNTKRYICPKDLIIDAGTSKVFEDEQIIFPNESLVGSASIAAKIDYIIYGKIL